MFAHTLNHPRRHPACTSRLGGALLLSLLGLLAPLALYPAHSAAAQRHLAAAFRGAGTLTIAMDGATVDLDPASEQSYASDMVARNIEEALIGFNGASMNSYRPLLATSWSANADKSVWTVHLRHNVRFHTSRCCLSATDVQYSIGRAVKAGLAGSYLYSRFLSDPFKQITVVDPYTIRFNLGRAQPIFPAALTSEYVGLILDAQALRAHASKSDPYAHAWASAHDLGTGPYMLQSWARNQEVLLDRFPAYWGGWSGSHFSRVDVRTVAESSTRRELIERGQADLTFNLTPQDYLALRSNPAVRVVAPYATEVDYAVMTEWGPLASPYARQALAYAFPYAAYIGGVFKGYAKRAYGPIPSALLGFDPHGFLYQTDLNKARALLQKAGVRPGTTLTYDYGTNGGPAGLLLQAQLAQLGIKLKVQHLSDQAMSSILFGTEPPSQRPSLMFQTWWPDYNDPWDMCDPLVASSSAGAAGANAGYYHNRTVDTLLAQMKNAGSATLISDAHKLQDITSRVDPAAIWVAEPAQVTVMASTLRGFVPNPIELHTYGFYALHH